MRDLLLPLSADARGPRPGGAPSEAVIRLEGLWKTYRVLRSPRDALGMLLDPEGGERVVALREVDLTVAEGEVVGLIGRNGAGKSTLLRVVAGVAPPTRGVVEVRGRPTPILDIRAGLNPFLSGRQNAAQRLEMLGAPRAEVPGLLAWIAAFAELEEVFDEPMFGLSTGQRMRLGFAIATALQGEVLLVDEVLAVGDGFFVARSFERLRALAHAGRAALVASHDWTKLFRLCQRVVWLEAGRIHRQGTPSALMYDYFRALNAYAVTGAARVTAVELLDAGGRPTRRLRGDGPVTLRIDFEAREARQVCVIAGWMHAELGESVLSAYSGDDGFAVHAAPGPGRLEARYERLPLAPGAYDVVVFLVEPDQGPFASEYLDIWGPTYGRDCRVDVEGAPGAGLVDLSVSWRCARREGGA